MQVSNHGSKTKKKQEPYVLEEIDLSNAPITGFDLLTPQTMNNATIDFLADYSLQNVLSSRNPPTGNPPIGHGKKSHEAGKRTKKHSHSGVQSGISRDGAKRSGGYSK